jgi:hypothetical protein
MGGLGEARSIQDSTQEQLADMTYSRLLPPIGILLVVPLAIAQLSTEAGAQYSALQPIKTAQAGTIAPPKPQDPDPLLDLPPVPKAGATLVGGTVEKVDRVRDRIVVKPFGGGRLEIAFDPRTAFLKGEGAASARDLRPGERVHVETVNEGSRIFAKKIHLGLEAAQGQVHGQVVAYNPGDGTLSINDELSARPVRFRIDKATQLSGQALTIGSLVEVNFLSGSNRALAREVKVLATPGSAFTFVGRITYLDLSSHSLVVASSTNDKRYAIRFNPQQVNAWDRLHEGTNVSVRARFDGENYTADDVVVMSAAVQQE